MGLATIPWNCWTGHVTLEVECLDRLYLNGYIGKLATGLGLGDVYARTVGQAWFRPPVVLGQISEKFGRP